MPKFNYNDYMSKTQAKKETAPTQEKSGFPKVEYLSKFLKKDGDYIVVRFPYSTTDDFDVVHVHNVMFPNIKYAQHVECTRNDDDPVDNCPLCKEGNKIVDRFLVKAIAYVHDVDESGKSIIKITPVVWDRPFGYAKELANKINEYGDLKEHLFKIKRSGTGTATVYSTDIVLNKAVYNPEVYKADFSTIEKVSPIRLCVRSIDKYNSVMKKPESEETVKEDKPIVVGKFVENTANDSFEEPKEQKPATTIKRSYSFN